MWDATWLFFTAPIDWTKAGGESFVQLWTGLNLAFVAWDKYQDALDWPRRKCDQIIEKTSCNVLDLPSRMKIVDLFLKWSKGPVIAHRWAWRICWTVALVAGLVGFYMLYVGRTGAWAVLLALPTVAYVSFSLINLTIFAVLTLVVGWCCKTVGAGTTAEIRKDIEELDESTRQPKLP